MTAKGFSHSVIGGREKNQDSFLVDNATSTYAVADGIGGGFEGELASKMAVEGIAKATAPTLTDAVKVLQEQVLKFATEKYGEPLMGTTLTVVRIEGSHCRLCHIGDSRCYLFDGTHIRQMTNDHESYDDANQGMVLTSYLGLDTSAFPLQIQEETFPVAAGNRLLLCSDGLYKQITESRIVALMQEHAKNPELLLTTLCDEASKVDFSDNVTIVYVEIE